MQWEIIYPWQTISTSVSGPPIPFSILAGSIDYLQVWGSGLQKKAAGGHSRPSMLTFWTFLWTWPWYHTFRMGVSCRCHPKEFKYLGVLPWVKVMPGPDQRSAQQCPSPADTGLKNCMCNTSLCLGHCSQHRILFVTHLKAWMKKQEWCCGFRWNHEVDPVLHLTTAVTSVMQLVKGDELRLAGVQYVKPLSQKLQALLIWHSDYHRIWKDCVIWFQQRMDHGLDQSIVLNCSSECTCALILTQSGFEKQSWVVGSNKKRQKL